MLLLLALAVGLVVGGRPQWRAWEDEILSGKVEFDRWMEKHGKKYATKVDYLNRLAIFMENVRKVELLNVGSNGVTFAVNKFADLTAAEFSRMLGYVPSKNRPVKSSLSLPVGAAPSSWDWGTKNKLTPVKDQGQCGSPWAYSVVENIESVWMIVKDPTNFIPLSIQQIVDCDTVGSGCDGGDPINAYEYVIQAGGLESDADYPDNSTTCQFDKAKVEARISSWKYATNTNNEEEMKEATYSIGPLAICVDAETWQFYAGGVMNSSQCGTSLDHCAQITAYDTTSNPPFWRVRNSWGSFWGENGFIRLQYGTNTCGLAEVATTAIV